MTPESNWPLVHLRDVAMQVSARVKPAADDNRRFIGLEHVESGSTRINGWISAAQMRSASASFVAGDVLYGRLRPYLNKVCAPGFDGLASSEFIILRPSAKLLPRFLLYRMLSTDFVTYATLKSHGDRPRAKWKQLAEFSVALPPLEDQRRIVEIIEEQLTRLDAAECQLARAKGNLATLRVSVMRSAFSMKGVPRIRISDCALVGSGATPLKSRKDFYQGGTIPWVTSGQLLGDFVTKPAAFITPLALAETSVKIWPTGALLLAMYGEGRTRGHCSELCIDATTNQACAAIVLHEDSPLQRAFLKLFFKATYEDNRRLAMGGVQPNLSLALIRKMCIPCPSQEVQREVADNLLRQLSIYDNLESEIERSLQRCIQLRRAILAVAFSQPRHTT